MKTAARRYILAGGLIDGRGAEVRKNVCLVGMGIIPGEAVSEEMKLFIKAGYSLAETVRCASANGAEFFAMGNLGALTVGNRATFLLTRGTASQLPRKLSSLEGIYVDGSPGNLSENALHK